MVRIAAAFLATSFLALSGLVAALPQPEASTQPSLEGIPVGSADGFYLGYLKEDGSTVWEYAGETSEHVRAKALNTTITLPSTAEDSSKGELVKRDSTHCNGFGVPANEANVAQGMLADMCGDGYFFNARSIARVYKNAVAFGCNYRSGQTCRHGDLWLYFGFVNRQCGFAADQSAGAGWYRIDKAKASYGRTALGSGFC